MLPSVLLARLAPIFADLAVGNAAAAEANRVLAADLATASRPAAERPAADAAAALRQRFIEGWHIRDVAYGGELALTLQRGELAERHTIEFDGRGAITGHGVTPAVASAEPRVFAAEQQLVQALATESAPLHVYEECGVPVMYFEQWAIAFDADDYYVVERSTRGRAARRLLADTLGGAIVRDVAASGGASIDYIVDAGAGSSYQLHVERDGDDTIVGAELRQTPERVWGGYYEADSDAIAAAGAVEQVLDGGRILVLAGGERIAIDAFVAVDDDGEDAGCGC